MKKVDLNFDALFRLVLIDNPDLGLEDSLRTLERMIAHPGKPGACIHQMPNGATAVLHGSCMRCGSTVTMKPQHKPENHQIFPKERLH